MAKCVVPKTASQGGQPPLTGEQLAKAQASIKEAIRLVDDAVYVQLANQLPTLWERWKAWTEANLSIIGRLADVKATQQRISDGLAQERFLWEALKKNLLWPAANQGRIGEGDFNRAINADEVKWLLCSAQSTVERYGVLVDLADQFSKGSIGFSAVSKLFVAVAERIAKLSSAVGKVADAGTMVIGWLPWIAGALILGPFLLRSFSAYRRGGASAAADAAASSLEEGRAAVGRGARAAWEGGKSLAKRAASGGVLKGAPRRYRKRRRARA